VEQPSPTPECPNCRAALQGRFCHQCGQEARANLLTVRDFLAEAVHELFSLDGKVPRTVRLFLTAPGKLVREHIEGRRAPYVSPLRLYLLVSVLHVISLFIFGGGGPLDLESSFPGGASDDAGEVATGTSSPGSSSDAEAARRRKQDAIDDQIRPAALLAIPPVAALVLMAAFRKRNPYYAGHLALALHLQAFFFFVSTFEDPLRWPLALVTGALGTPADRALQAAVILASIAYSLVGMRRVYQVDWRTVLIRGSLVIAGFMMVVVAVVGLAAGVSVLLAR
jgi:hypothetical protein